MQNNLSKININFWNEQTKTKLNENNFIQILNNFVVKFVAILTNNPRTTSKSLWQHLSMMLSFSAYLYSEKNTYTLQFTYYILQSNIFSQTNHVYTFFKNFYTVFTTRKTFFHLQNKQKRFQNHKFKNKNKYNKSYHCIK